MLVLLDGDPALGKSTITIDLSSRVSRGAVMPDGSAGCAAAGVVIVSAEDDPRRIIRPRLDAASADLSRVAMVQVREGEDLRDPMLTPEDLPAIGEAIARVSARLVIVDPLMAFLPSDVDSHRDQDVRRTLAALADLAERTGAAILIVRHLRKSSSESALYRGGGSIGIIGAARAAMVVARDPDDDSGERRVLAATKCNLCAMPESLGYRVVSTEGHAPRIEWLGTVAHGADAILAPRAPDSERDAESEAVEWLRGRLADGAEVPVRDLEGEARAAGIAARTLRRARGTLGIRARRAGSVGSAQRWIVSMPREGGDDPSEGEPAEPPDERAKPFGPLVLGPLDGTTQPLGGQGAESGDTHERAKPESLAASVAARVCGTCGHVDGIAGIWSSCGPPDYGTRCGGCGADLDHPDLPPLVDVGASRMLPACGGEVPPMLRRMSPRGRDAEAVRKCLAHMRATGLG